MAGAKHKKFGSKPRVADEVVAGPAHDGAILALGLAADPRIAQALLANAQPAYAADPAGKLVGKKAPFQHTYE